MLEHCNLKDWLYSSLSTPLMYAGVSFFINKIFVTYQEKKKNIYIYIYNFQGTAYNDWLLPSKA